MPRTKGSKNRPKINTTNDYASQIAKKAEAESVVKRLLASDMSADEILDKDCEGVKTVC